jgi:hypothetical protein
MVLLIKQNMMQQLMQLKTLPELKKNEQHELVREEKKKADIINLKIKEYFDEENIQQIMHYKTERERIRYEAELAAANNWC